MAKPPTASSLTLNDITDFAAAPADLQKIFASSVSSAKFASQFALARFQRGQPTMRRGIIVVMRTIRETLRQFLEETKPGNTGSTASPSAVIRVLGVGNAYP